MRGMVRRKFPSHTTKETAMKTKMKYFGSTLLLLAAISFSAAACTTTGSMGGDDETLYKRMPATEHQKKHPAGHGNDHGKACFYDRAEDVYYCSFK